MMSLTLQTHTYVVHNIIQYCNVHSFRVYFCSLEHCMAIYCRESSYTTELRAQKLELMVTWIYLSFPPLPPTCIYFPPPPSWPATCTHFSWNKSPSSYSIPKPSYNIIVYMHVHTLHHKRWAFYRESWSSWRRWGAERHPWRNSQSRCGDTHQWNRPLMVQRTPAGHRDKMVESWTEAASLLDYHSLEPSVLYNKQDHNLRLLTFLTVAESWKWGIQGRIWGGGGKGQMTLEGLQVLADLHVVQQVLIHLFKHGVQY